MRASQHDDVSLGKILKSKLPLMLCHQFVNDFLIPNLDDTVLSPVCYCDKRNVF